MGRWARPFVSSLLALLALALVPASASAATVERDTETGVITIVDDVATADDILVDPERRRRHRQPTPAAA